VKQSKIYIYGKHAVREALVSSPRIIRKVLLSPKMDDRKLRDILRNSGVPVEPLDERQATSQVPGGAMHQGLIALISLSELTVSFADFYKNFSPTPDTSLVVLDEIVDPHNVGAVVRNAVAFGATAVLLPKHKQSPVTGGAIKASAGMAFKIPIVEVDNLQQAIALLKKSGMRVYGLAAEGKQSVGAETFSAPSVFVLGNEAKGVAPAIRALCDQTLSINLSLKAESLNVAASSAVALYAWSLQHPSALK
jgi:23S rRNA (guanosine2251-2'-O)-methyltransferase